MALSDDVQDRIPSQLLKELTNPRDPDATTIDSTLLAKAATDVQARFETYAEEEYDSSVTIHVSIAVEGVVGLLRRWGAGKYGAAKEFWADFREECERMAMTRTRARITPTSSSELTPSDENPDGGTKRPWADDQHFTPLHTRHTGAVDLDED